MQFTLAVLAVAGLAAALPGDSYGYPGQNSPYSPGQECQTSSTCNAVYKTITSSVPSETTSTVVKTVTEAVTKTEQAINTVTVTQPSVQVQTVTQTVTKSVPYEAFKVTTICQTSTISYQATKTETAIITVPETKTVQKVITTESQCPTVITTWVPSVQTITSTISTNSPTVITQTEQNCQTATSCKATSTTLSSVTTSNKPYQPTAPVYAAPPPTYE